MKKIRKGDEVVVLAGKDKGRIGVVLGVYKDGKLVVAGVNVYKRHADAGQRRAGATGFVDKTMPIDASNVALMDAEGRPSRVGFRIEDGRKVRYLKRTGEVVPG